MTYPRGEQNRTFNFADLWVCTQVPIQIVFMRKSQLGDRHPRQLRITRAATLICDSALPLGLEREREPGLAQFTGRFHSSPVPTRPQVWLACIAGI